MLILKRNVQKKKKEHITGNGFNVYFSFFFFAGGNTMRHYQFFKSRTLPRVRP